MISRPKCRNETIDAATMKPEATVPRLDLVNTDGAEAGNVAIDSSFANALSGGVRCRDELF
jgi:hypothetical protein